VFIIRHVPMLALVLWLVLQVAKAIGDKRADTAEKVSKRSSRVDDSSA
jgi:hypothetical protein